MPDGEPVGEAGRPHSDTMAELWRPLGNNAVMHDGSQSKTCSLTEFAEFFGSTSGWGMLAGSAVSSPAPTSAPMVGQSLSAIFEAAGRELALRNRRLGFVYQSITRKLDVHAVQANLKFEVALSHCDAQRPGTSLEIVRALFAGLPANQNHAAVARLHRAGRLKWLLTTNFDGGFEATGEYRGIALPTTLGIRDGRVTKLHGDADTGQDIVATMNRMVERKNFALIGGVISALQGVGMERLLIVGYSGRGDIDVLPELRSASERGLELWWAVRRGSRAPSDVRVAGVVEHDLFGSSNNVLLQLSGISEPMGPVIHDAIMVRSIERLGVVFAAFSDVELLRVPVALMMEANLGWQPAKILLAANIILNEPLDDQWSLACERMSAYFSALRHLKRAEASPRKMQRAADLAREAFLLQESGLTKAARRRFAFAQQEALGPQGGSATFQQSDFIWRGWLESEIERGCSMWRARSRRDVLLPLRDRCLDLLREAEFEEPATAAVLRLRLAEIDFATATTRDGRMQALRLASQALSESSTLQHADGVAVAMRFLNAAGGREGRAFAQVVLSRTEQRTQRPAREALKGVLARFQSALPLGMLPWKLQLPLIGLVKLVTASALEVRLRFRRIVWRAEILRIRN